MLRIHFICRSNIWRSRIAEAYAKSLLKDDDNIIISSSGIEAGRNLEGDISAYTRQVLEMDNLWTHAKPKWTQTSQALIDGSDQIVFLDNDIFEDAKSLFNIPKAKTIVWRIPGRNDVVEQIKQNVRELLSKERP